MSKQKIALTPEKIGLAFPIKPEDIVNIRPNGVGNVNSTFHLEVKTGPNTSKEKYILQKINTFAFKNPKELMENILNVTSFVTEKTIEHGGDPNKESMQVILTNDGETYFTDAEGSAWRVYTEVEDTYCISQVERPEQFYESARAFGHFQFLLNEFDASILHETIPNFHNTPVRYQDLENAIKNDKAGRLKDVQAEVKFIRDHSADISYLQDRQDAGILPLRVTHNDTKLNNVLFDKQTDKALAVIDLDTVMPGLSAHDFGDAIRFGANEANEDETDLSKVKLNLELFEAYTRGYFEECGDILSEAEKDDLVWGSKIITLELAMRFLTDYLEGDPYFNIDYADHNLDRTRTQLELVKEMEKNWDDMIAIIKKYR